jgi:hypothetical protein
LECLFLWYPFRAVASAHNEETPIEKSRT